MNNRPVWDSMSHPDGCVPANGLRWTVAEAAARPKGKAAGAQRWSGGLADILRAKAGSDSDADVALTAAEWDATGAERVPCVGDVVRLDARRVARPARLGFVERCVLRLLDGEEGAAVVEAMRAHYGTHCALSAKIVRARALFLRVRTPEARVAVAADASNRHPRYDALARALRRRVARRDLGGHPCRDAALGFLDAPLSEQVRLQRQYRSRIAPACTGHAGVTALLRKLPLLPDNLKTFHVDEDEALACKRRSKEARVRKNENALVLDDGAALVDRAAAALRAASRQTPFPELAWPLLLVSGRRFTEIMNGRSVFSPLPGREYACLFDGQLKKGEGAASPPYTIPLLVPFRLFASALAVLRDKQAAGRGRPVASLTPEQVAVRYHGNYCRHIEANLPEVQTGHDLRGLYVALVYQAFDWRPAMMNVVAMRCLGHVDIETSLSYNHLVSDVRRLRARPPVHVRGDAFAPSDASRRVHVRGGEVTVDGTPRAARWPAGGVPADCAGVVREAHRNGLVTLEDGTHFENPAGDPPPARGRRARG